MSEQQPQIDPQEAATQRVALFLAATAANREAEAGGNFDRTSFDIYMETRINSQGEQQ